MAQYQLSYKESSLLDIMKIFGKDDMAELIGHTDQKQTFDDINAAIEAGQMANMVHCSITHKQQVIWDAFLVKEAEPSYHYNEAAYEAAAKLVVDAWVNYPRPGTEQPNTPGRLNGNQRRRELCQKLFPYAEKIHNKITEVDQMTQNQYWNYSIATLLDKLCWYYYELSNHTEASNCAERAVKMCESAMENMMVFEHYAKWLVLLSDMQQARAVIASELGDVYTAMTFGQKQIETATAATGSAPLAKTTELARAYMVMGNIMIIADDYAAAEAYFNRAIPVLQALPGYHRLQMYTILHGLGWIHLLKREYHIAENCFNEALHDREAAYGVDDTEGMQTGELYYSLGTVSAIQGKMLESFNYYTRGRTQLEAVTGTKFHWNVAKMKYKLAGHHILRHEWDSAYVLLVQCDEYYMTSPDYFKGLRARIHFHLFNIYVRQGNRFHALDAGREAWKLKKELRPHDRRRFKQLTGGSYDALVVVWCR